jgi:hypothetical protein
LTASVQMWDWQGPLRKQCWVLSAECVAGIGASGGEEVRKILMTNSIVLTTRVHIAY